MTEEQATQAPDDADESSDIEDRGVPAVMHDLVGPAFDQIDERMGRHGVLVPTGFLDLDRLTGDGLAVGSTTAVFGHTGVGASTLVLNFAVNASLTAGVSALVVSWESDRDAIVTRVLASVGRVPMTRLKSSRLDEGDWKRIAAGMGTLSEAPLTAVNGPATTGQFVKMVDDWAVSTPGGARLLVLDGLPHLARLVPDVDESVWNAHTRLTALVKNLALSRRIAVVYTVPTVVDVLRRPRKEQRPRLGDVAYSPAYVIDADLVIGLHREDLHEKESPRAGEADLEVLKFKHGPTDIITVAFQGHYQRFVDLIA